jgi:hypothetical protein
VGLTSSTRKNNPFEWSMARKRAEMSSKMMMTMRIDDDHDDDEATKWP